MTTDSEILSLLLKGFYPELDSPLPQSDALIYPKIRTIDHSLVYSLRSLAVFKR